MNTKKMMFLLGIVFSLTLFISLPSQAVQKEIAPGPPTIAEPCNGGDAESPSGNVLGCPESGGPTCVRNSTKNEECRCVAVPDGNGGYSPANRCVEP